MVTPTASEMRKNAASEASSFNSVARATTPAPSAITKPAISPPAVMANSESPETQEADRRAGQDRMRHRVADQAHAAQHQEHADRPGAERERERADQRAAHEGELDERGDEGVVDHAC